jgi:hypothetical protein
MTICNLLCILTAIFSFIAILRDDVDTDYKKWKDNIPVRHNVEGWIRAIWLLIPFILLCFPIGFRAFYIPAGLLFFFYLTLFDGLYNSKRRINFWSLGSIDKDDPITDRILRKFPRKTQITVKIGGMFIFLSLYILKLFHLI